MPKRRLPRGLSTLAGIVGLTAAVLWSQDQAQKSFRPPRLGVVDQNRVFDLYNKKQDRKDEFEGQVKSLDDKLKEFEKRHKQIVAELPNLEPGKKRDDMELEKLKIEQQVRTLKDTEYENLQKIQLKYLQEIRDEISEEIQNYAKALDLDLVLDKEINASLSPTTGIRWPIVHFAKPEIEITQEIADRLNGRYKPSRPTSGSTPQPKNGGAAVGQGTKSAK